MNGYIEKAGYRDFSAGGTFSQAPKGYNRFVLSGKVFSDRSNYSFSGESIFYRFSKLDFYNYNVRKLLSPLKERDKR